jgi:endonuclease-3
VCNRLGLARGKTEEQTAQQLDDRAPDWAKRDGHIWLITFAKRICTSRAPKCATCPLADLCEAYQAGHMAVS